MNRMFTMLGGAAVAAGHRERIESLAHRSRGSAALFGVTALVALFTHLETMAHDDDLDRANDLLDNADVALTQFRATLETTDEDH